MSQLDTVPPSIDVSTSETLLPITIDTTQYLAGGTGWALQTNPVPTAYMLSQANGITVPTAINGAPAIRGNNVQVTLNCGALKAGQSYTLQVNFWVTATNVLTSLTTINAVI